MVDVPTIEQFNALKAQVEALTVEEIPQDVKDALLIVANWLITKVS